MSTQREREVPHPLDTQKAMDEIRRLFDRYRVTGRTAGRFERGVDAGRQPTVPSGSGRAPQRDQRHG